MNCLHDLHHRDGQRPNPDIIKKLNMNCLHDLHHRDGHRPNPINCIYDIPHISPSVLKHTHDHLLYDAQNILL